VHPQSSLLLQLQVHQPQACRSASPPPLGCNCTP
jgi:hypothetical protein